jgi:hypothetical protein
MVSGTTCPLSEQPRTSKNEFLDMIKEVLLAVAELFRNDTAVGILHSMKLPEKTEFDMILPPHDGKCVTMVVRPDTHMAVLSLLMQLHARM